MKYSLPISSLISCSESNPAIFFSANVTLGRCQSCCHEYSHLFGSIAFLLVSNKSNLQFICQSLVTLMILGQYKLAPEKSNPFSRMAILRITSLSVKQFRFPKRTFISLVMCHTIGQRISSLRITEIVMLALCTVTKLHILRKNV